MAFSLKKVGSIGAIPSTPAKEEEEETNAKPFTLKKIGPIDKTPDVTPPAEAAAEAQPTGDILDAAARSIGISGRVVAQGLANMLGIVGDPLNTIVNQFLPDSKKLSTLRQATKTILKAADVPDYEGKTEEFIGNLGELAVETLASAGTAGMAARGAKAAQAALPTVTKPATRVLESIAEEPVKQAVTATGGYLGGKAIEEVAPESTLGQIAGTVAGGAVTGRLTGMGKGPAGAYKPPEAIKRGEELGVDILTSDVLKPEAPLSKLAQFTAERLPFGTTKLRHTQLEQQKQMVVNYVEEVGANVPEDIKALVVDDVVKKRQGLFNRFSKLKNNVYDKLERKGSVPARKLTSVIDDEIAVAEHNNLDAYVRELKNLKDQVTSATQPASGGRVKQANIRSMDKARSLFGEKLETDEFAGMREHIGRSKQKIYSAFNEDIGNFIKTEGSEHDYKMWKAANKKIHDLFEMEKMNSYKKVLKSADIRPEVVKTMIHTQDTSEAKLLYKSASPKGKKLIRAALIQDIVEKKGGIENITAKQFVNEITKRSRAVGIFYDKQNRDVLNSMAELLKDTVRAEKSANYTPIGISMPLLAFSTLEGIFGGGAKGAAAAAVTGSTLGLLSRVAESKQSRDLLLKIHHLKTNRTLPDRDKKLEVAVRRFYNILNAYQQEEKTNE